MTSASGTGLTGYRTVIEQNLQPVGGVVAHITCTGRGNMRSALTKGNDIIVAILTSVRGLIMGKRLKYRLPKSGTMTAPAHVAGHGVGS